MRGHFHSKEKFISFERNGFAIRMNFHIRLIVFSNTTNRNQTKT